MNSIKPTTFFSFFKNFLSLLLLVVVSQAFGQRYTFNKIGLEDGMPSSRINDFIQDSRGFFWLATEGAGLVRYDGFEFKTIDMGAANLRPLVTALAEDGAGNIWLANTNALVRYDGLSFSFYYLPATTDRISKILVNPAGEIFITGKNQAYRLGQKDTLEVIVNERELKINDIAWYESDLWYATNSGIYNTNAQKLDGDWSALQVDSRGLYATGKEGYVLLSDGRVNWKSKKPAQLLSVGRKKEIRLGASGLLIEDDGKEAIIGVENGLPDENFEGCFLDPAGVAWLYSSNGLVKLQSTATKLYGAMDGIDSKVYSVLADRNGYYSAGSANGLSLIQGDKIKHITDDQFPYGVILALAEYQGVTWLGTETGLIRYNGSDFTSVTLPGSFGSYVFALKGTSSGLYIGTSSGILKYENGRIINITERENLPFANVFAISQGKDGSLWFGTYTQGFIRKFKDDWEVIDQLGQVSFDSLRFNTFSVVSKDEIWAGTLSEGIFHIANDAYDNISSAQLNFAEIRSMDLDSRGKLWLGTNKGISNISKNSEGYQINNLNILGRLLDEGCSPQALQILNDQLVAGTSEGLLLLSIDELEKTRVRPEIAITLVELYFGESEELKEYAQNTSPFSDVPRDLNLPNNLNFLSFTLAGLSGYHQEDLVYRYRIKGQNAWTLAGGRREAVYSNLKPGTYVFEAQVSRDGEEWGTSVATYPFVIRSPIWLRWWFITLAVLLTASLVYIYLSNRIKRINQRLRLENSLLDMERKALRLQMNPHFIFNALDSISSFIFKNDPKQAVRYLNNFAKLMRLTLESSMEHLHPVETEVSILKNYLELEKLRFQGKFDYEIHIDDEIDYDVGIPPMLIQPHVENAILHGIKPKKEKGHIFIRFILEEELLICEIEDDGIGRKKAKEQPKRHDHRSMATQINHDRIRLLKISKSDEIDIEILDKENPTGTKVTIKLPAENI